MGSGGGASIAGVSELGASRLGDSGFSVDP